MYVCAFFCRLMTQFAADINVKATVNTGMFIFYAIASLHLKYING